MLYHFQSNYFSCRNDVKLNSLFEAKFEYLKYEYFGLHLYICIILD